VKKQKKRESIAVKSKRLHSFFKYIEDELEKKRRKYVFFLANDKLLLILRLQARYL
jgi:hypothetical protein